MIHMTELESKARETALRLALDNPQSSLGRPFKSTVERAEEYRKFLMGEVSPKASTITVVVDHEAGTYTVVPATEAA